jgi:hypothetical protein
MCTSQQEEEALQPNYGFDSDTHAINQILQLYGITAIFIRKSACVTDLGMSTLNTNVLGTKTLFRQEDICWPEVNLI